MWTRFTEGDFIFTFDEHRENAGDEIEGAVIQIMFMRCVTGNDPYKIISALIFSDVKNKM